MDKEYFDMDKGYIDTYFTVTKNEDSDSQNIQASIKYVEFETNNEVRIGHANIYLFNEYRFNSWIELLDNADAISGDVLEVIVILEKASENEEINGLIAVLDNIEINQQYRGMGYGEQLLQSIIDYFEFINANYLGLIPARFFDNKVVQNDQNAIDFYIKKGFKPLSFRAGGNIVMGLSLL